MRGVSTAGERLLSSPITGIARCCARAAIGHTAAAPPSSVMNSRRFNLLNIRTPLARAELQDIKLTRISQRVSWAFCNRSVGPMTGWGQNAKTSQ